MDSEELAFAGCARQAELVAIGEVSSRELVQACLDRIERLDPTLNAFRVVYAERALAEADQAQARLKAGGEARPLLGVPVAIKDDADVAGEVTAWGSGAQVTPARQDSEVVARLRGAGAIVIGKTNLPELAIWPFTESRRFGVTRNPWDTARTPGGSSGGSAAAVASGMVGCALGSDGGGSIRIPSACCGLFGLKPQRDRIPLAPQTGAEAWLGLSVFGPLARRVGDAALFLDVTADPRSLRAPAGAAANESFTAAAARPPGKLRVAVSAKVPPGLIAKVDAEVRASLERTAELLSSLGHEIVWQDPQYGLASLAFLARYLRGIRDDARSVERPSALEPRTRQMARAGALIAPPLLARALRDEERHAARINRLFERCDVLVTPTFARTAVEVGRWEGQGALRTFNGVGQFVPFCAIWNYTGQPAAAVPAGLSSAGLPLSVQLVGRPNDEATLLSLAAQIEAERPWAQRQPPGS